MKSFVILSTLIFISVSAHGQLVAGDGASLNVSNVISTNGSVYNSGSLAWGTNSLLFLNGEGELLTSEGSSLNNLKIDGVYQLHNSINVANSLTLIGGTLTLINNAQLILLNSATITSENGAFVSGSLFHQGTGEKFCPIGKNGVFTPVTLTDVQGDEDVIVGLEAFNEPLGVDAQAQGWYWQVTSQGNFEGSLIQLPILDADGITYSVLQSDGVTTTNLGGNLTGDFQAVESQQLITGPFVFLGTDSGEDAVLTIHNIITPGLEDGKNDAFYIENIDRYSENTVIVMDRWGTEVCRMENFSNDPVTQQGCDLERLPAGNYICVAKYAGVQSKPVLITILK